MSSFYQAFVNTLLLFVLRSNNVHSNIHHGFCAFASLLRCLLCAGQSRPPSARCPGESLHGHNTTAGPGSLLLLCSTSVLGQGILAKNDFMSWRPTMLYSQVPYWWISFWFILLRSIFYFFKGNLWTLHCIQQMLRVSAHPVKVVNLHKSWVNSDSGPTPALPAGGGQGHTSPWWSWSRSFLLFVQCRPNNNMDNMAVNKAPLY